MKLLVLLITTFLSASTFEINGVDITINEGVSAKANGHLINNGSLSNYGIIDFNDVITNNDTQQ